jgi:nucleoside-diphosphate-sugar epimerase
LLRLPTMKVLITGANGDLGAALAASLTGAAAVSEVRLTDRTPQRTDVRNASDNFWQNTLGDDASTSALVQGIDQIVHTEPLVCDGGESGDEWLDRACRCTYNLLHAAAVAGVSRVVWCVPPMSCMYRL